MRTLRGASPHSISLHHFETRFLVSFLLLVSCSPAGIEKQKIDVKQELFPIKDEQNLPLIIELFKNRYVDSFTYIPERDTSIAALCGRVDPFTFYLSKRENHFFTSKIEGESFVDFGFKVVIENDTPIVMRINASSECRKKGLCIGDRLLEFNDEVLLRKSQSFLDSLLENYTYSGATLKLFRPAYGAENTIAIKMSPIAGGSACCAFMLSERVGYLWFGDFSEGIARRIADSITNLQRNNQRFTHLIIDLRGNHGGIADEALSLLGLFYHTAKPVLAFRSPAHQVFDKEEYLQSKEIFGGLRLIVLTNDRTWSAAEILSGTLQDLDRAIIVGQQTGGKGLAMNKLTLPGGEAIVMSTSRFYLPSGRCLQIPYENGIMNGRLLSPRTVLSNPLHKYEASYKCSEKVFYTLSRRPVYGEMGVIPDFFVPDNIEMFIRELTREQRHQIYRKFVDRYQARIMNSYSYKTFTTDFPTIEAIEYLNKDLDKIKKARFSHEDLIGTVNRMMEWVQEDYFGQGTQTANTLLADRYVEEAKRLIAVDMQTEKKELVVKTKSSKKSLKKIKFAQK